MSKFLTDLVVAEMDDSTWKLWEEFKYSSDILGKDIVVPKGFVTDFASVPRAPLAYWLAGDTAHQAAVIHDFLYQTHPCVRGVADAVLLEAMTVTDIPLWRRRIIYRAVRLFGWIPWRSGPKRLIILGNVPK